MAEFVPNPRFSQLLEAAVHEGLRAHMVIVSSALRLQLSKRGSGRIYRRGKRLHQASAAGEPPAPDTGTLRRSWQIGNPNTRLRDYRRSATIGWVLGSALHYARIERNYGRVKARPYIRPTLKRTKDLMGRTVARAIQRAVVD